MFWQPSLLRLAHATPTRLQPPRHPLPLILLLSCLCCTHQVGASGLDADRVGTASGRRLSTAVPTSADVIVVGAGMAGIKAARDLVAAGASVIVLEGRARVGGRQAPPPAAPPFVRFAQASATSVIPSFLPGPQNTYRGACRQGRQHQGGPRGKLDPRPDRQPACGAGRAGGRGVGQAANRL